MGLDLRYATPAQFATTASNGAWKPARHLLLLNRILLAAAAGEPWAQRVIVQMPPRHGKSEFLSGFFPAWYLGMFPDRKVILASYEQGLAASWGQRNRDLLEVYGPRFFGVRLRNDSSAKANWLIQRRRGGMFTTGIGGALTGKGANVLIVDDPVKNDREALSPTYRQRNKDWYRATARTRLESPGAIIVIQTRWHSDDLAGWLQAESDEDWLVISLPAIAEKDEEIILPGDTKPAWTRAKGEPLWPEVRPMADLLKAQKAMGGEQGHWWLALYQQRPVPIGGGILKPEQFRRYSLVPNPTSRKGSAAYLLDRPSGPSLVHSEDLRKFATVDLAATVKTQSDWTVVAVCALNGPDLIVLDVLRGKWEGPDLAPVIHRVWEAYRPSYVGVEQAGFQVSVVQDLRRGDPSKGRRPVPVKALKPQGDKISRALTLAARMGGGNVYVPESAPWLAALEAEFSLFPMGDHDDQVDTLAYAALEQGALSDALVRGAG